MKRNGLSLVLAAALTLAACLSFGSGSLGTSQALACLPCMNCGAEICCPPPQARAARVELLRGLGAPAAVAEKMADEMKRQGVVFMPESFAAELRKLVDHPGGRK